MQKTQYMTKRLMIAGPTASGKTSLAINLAQSLNAEIISVDSRQCYKRLDIGTAKPTPDELAAATHYNISVLDLTHEDTVADFLKRVEAYENEIKEKGRNIIYCGGSTLHLQSVLRPLDDIPKANERHISELNKTADEKGIEYLYKQLEEIDPDYIKKMDGMNRQRIIRALDVWKQTGKPFSSYHENKKISPPDDLEVIVLNHPRKELHKRIATRTELMMEQGLIRETEEILSDGYPPHLQALNTVGYREVIAHLHGKMSYNRMVEKIKTSTRRYAKRQITWFRRWPFATWLNMHEKTPDEAAGEISSKLNLKIE